ncbi:hypothetical protein [Flagellimonas algicola]|uniref:Uncharacterized protein n=1 Tax=Flagellimonas algicola TaxID=2583815 RepID=A0ABY2WIP8_9FLAO|nr:hypothetical protein [Allomuricauda algicola]TMU54436.1 hypothetical protein FGG15_09440 [Allomuricauda algicola]
MESNFNTSLEIVEFAQQEQLYDSLLLQLSKDFALANAPLDFPKEIGPKEVKSLLHEKIYFLILEKFQNYLNLLYIVDIPEQEIKKLTTLDAVDASSVVCFLILKREWQKVWFRHKYNS